MKYRTILCEDNKYVREVFNYIFKERGHEVFSFKDAGDCPLNSLTECNCNHVNPCSDIIISDVSMPKVNGLEFVESLRKIGCKIKNIALVSGYWTKKDILRAKKIGCTVFHKPLKNETLNEWINLCERNINPERILSKKLPSMQRG